MNKFSKQKNKFVFSPSWDITNKTSWTASGLKRCLKEFPEKKKINFCKTHQITERRISDYILHNLHHAYYLQYAASITVKWLRNKIHDSFSHHNIFLSCEMVNRNRGLFIFMYICRMYQVLNVSLTSPLYQQNLQSAHFRENLQSAHFR